MTCFVASTLSTVMRYNYTSARGNSESGLVKQYNPCLKHTFPQCKLSRYGECGYLHCPGGGGGLLWSYWRNAWLCSWAHRWVCSRGKSIRSFNKFGTMSSLRIMNLTQKAHIFRQTISQRRLWPRPGFRRRLRNFIHRGQNHPKSKYFGLNIDTHIWTDGRVIKFVKFFFFKRGGEMREICKILCHVTCLS